MKYSIISLALLLLISAPLQAASGGSSGGNIPQSRTPLTPEQKAAVAYNSGLKHRDKAAKHEEKSAAESREKQLAKLEKKIAKEYGKAIKDYRKSINYVADYYEVHGSLGYALRKVGLYDESLAAYNESLRINPSYGNAIEYRGEAYLGLHRLDDAKDAYIALFKREPVLADQLLTAMAAWVAEQRESSTNVDGEMVDSFATWVQQRSELASFVQPPSDTAAERWAPST